METDKHCLPFLVFPKLHAQCFLFLPRIKHSLEVASDFPVSIKVFLCWNYRFTEYDMIVASSSLGWYAGAHLWCSPSRGESTSLSFSLSFFFNFLSLDPHQGLCHCLCGCHHVLQSKKLVLSNIRNKLPPCPWASDKEGWTYHSDQDTSYLFKIKSL